MRKYAQGVGQGSRCIYNQAVQCECAQGEHQEHTAQPDIAPKTYARLKSGTGPLPEGCSNALDWKFIATVRECVMEHITSPDFNVDTLCEIQHMSRSSFFNKLKTLTGYAPADYIRSIRLQHAANLLIQERCTIIEVADATGFSDANILGKYSGNIMV